MNIDDGKKNFWYLVPNGKKVRVFVEISFINHFSTNVANLVCLFNNKNDMIDLKERSLDFGTIDRKSLD